MQPFYALTKNLNAKMLSGALVVLALALFIPFSTYLSQQRVSTSPQAGSETGVAESSITLSHHQFNCAQGDPQNGISSGSNCNQIAVGKIFAVDVQIRSDIDAANLVSVRLKYQPEMVRIEKIVTQGQSAQTESNAGSPKNAEDFFISSWVNRNYNNEQGVAQLIGAVPAPGFITAKDNKAPTMARVYFKAVTGGQTEITVDQDSAIFRNADNSNILKTTRDFSFTIN